MKNATFVSELQILSNYLSHFIESKIEQPHDDLHSLSLRRCSRVMAAEMKIKSEPHAMLRKSIETA